MKYGWLIVAVFAARFIVTAVVYPQVDGDLSWQRWLGAAIVRARAIPHALGNETFTAAGAPWVPHEWLFSLAAFAGRSGAGWVIFSSATAACAIAALALAALRAEARGASPRAIALCAAVAGVALFESFGVRAQVVAWPFLAGYLALAERKDRYAWFALPLAAVWSNLHASAAMAPGLAALVALGALLEGGPRSPAFRRSASITALSAVAICCNPFGIGLPLYAFELLAAPFKAFIAEWKVTGLEDLSFRYGALPLLALALVAGACRRPRSLKVHYGDALSFVLFTYLLLGAARNIAIFALVALPLVAAALSEYVPWFAPEAPAEATRLDRAMRYALPAFSLTAAIVVSALLLATQPKPNASLARPALAALERMPGEHRVLCDDFAYCGLLVGAPHQRVFLDGRADPYPLRVWNDFVAIVYLRPDWRARLDAARVDTVVADRGKLLDQGLALSGDWRLAYSDAKNRIWLRRARLLAAR